MTYEKTIQDWLIEIHYQKPILIKRAHKSDKDIIKIMATNPGLLIGKGGRDIERLKERLGNRCTVELIEADEIICTPDTKIDTRDWSDIIEERVISRLEMWNM